MKLHPQFAADGTLWYENPVLAVSDRVTRIMRWAVLASLLGPAWIFLRAAAGNPVTFSLLDDVLIVAPFVLAYEYWRRVRQRAAGMPDASTPRRVGFTPSELVWENPACVPTRVPWSDIRGIGVAMYRGLNVTMFVRTDRGEYSLSNTNLDLLIKARWALRLFGRSALDLTQLSQEWTPMYPRTAPPPSEAEEVNSDPPLYLLPDRVILWKNHRGQEVLREEVDALSLPLLGALRFVVTVRDHQAGVILHEADARPLVAWLGQPPRPPATSTT